MSEGTNTNQIPATSQAEQNQNEVTINAGDSASQIRYAGSRISYQSQTSISSIKLRAFALKATAAAEAVALKTKQKISQMEMKQQQALQSIEWEKQNREIQLKLDKANALIEATRRFESEEYGIKHESQVETISPPPPQLSNAQPQKTHSNPKVPHDPVSLPINSPDPLNSTRNWLNTNNIPCPPSNPQPNELTPQYVIDYFKSQQEENMATKWMPKFELTTFNGDRLKYQDFIGAFETIVSIVKPNPCLKLFYLVHYVTEKVRKLFGYVDYSNPVQSYDKAMKILKQRYGQSFELTSAHLKPIINGPQIKTGDSDALQDFADELLSCTNYLSNINNGNELNNSENLVKIVRRFPNHMQNEWRSRADKIMYEDDNFVTIDDVTDFVQQKARQYSNPLFGVTQMNAMDQRKQPNKDNYRANSRFKNFSSVLPENNVNFMVDATSNLNPNFKCHMCAQPHFLNQCKLFRELDLDARGDFAVKQKLCFACLSNNHFFKSCKRKNPCQKCDRFHTTLLHGSSAVTDPVESNTNNNSNKASTSKQNNYNKAIKINVAKSTSCSTQSETYNTFLPVVPIKVKNSHDNKSILTYALLDSGSNITFCTNALADKLNLKQHHTNINMSTLSKKNENIKTCLINNIQITDIDDNHTLTIPQTFTRSHIPIERDTIPTQNDLDKWDYLRTIDFPIIDNLDVGFILGLDVSLALEPMEIVNSKNNGPYAIRTKLGWALNGKRSHKAGNEYKHSYFVNANKNQLCRLCTDYIDSTVNDVMEPSIQQIKFIEHAKSSIKLKNNHYEVDLPLKSCPAAMPDNKTLVYKRLQSPNHKFNKNKTFYNDYVKFVENMISEGHAELVPNEEENKPLTARGLPSYRNSIFDPVEFLVLILLTAKLILRDLTKLKLNWDDGISDKYKNMWTQWNDNLSLLEQFSVDRCIKPPSFGKIKSTELHHFADSSEDAIAACGYRRLTNNKDEVHTLLLAKSQLAPPKKISMPRLELIGVTLSIKNDKLLRKELDLGTPVFWSDYMAVLYYMKNETKWYKTFVANRVSLIRNSSDQMQWKYINTKINPADAATHWMKSFLELKQWLACSVPEYLCQPAHSWPPQPNKFINSPEGEKKIKEESVIATNKSPNEIDQLMSKFFRWSKRIISWFLRFKNNSV